MKSISLPFRDGRYKKSLYAETKKFHPQRSDFSRRNQKSRVLQEYAGISPFQPLQKKGGSLKRGTAIGNL